MHWLPFVFLIRARKMRIYFFADETVNCVCFDVTPGNTSLDDIIRQIIRNLTVDRNELSSTRRQLSSAEDERISSKCIGISGVIIMTCFCSLFIINDIADYSYYKYNRRWFSPFQKTVNGAQC